MPSKILILIFICFILYIPSHSSYAETNDNLKQKAYADFEKKMLTLVISSIEILDKQEQAIDEETYYNLALSAQETFVLTSRRLKELRIPAIFSEKIGSMLSEVKKEFSEGFRLLAESMEYLARAIAGHNNELYEKSKEKFDEGNLLINSAYQSLATVRLRMNNNPLFIVKRQFPLFSNP
ncbi:hypothetical protein GN156_14185 [bacterium LRH843]|nr:hypothetical protein [bacterium LRH843]